VNLSEWSEWTMHPLFWTCQMQMGYELWVPVLYANTSVFDLTQTIGPSGNRKPFTGATFFLPRLRHWPILGSSRKISRDSYCHQIWVNTTVSVGAPNWKMMTFQTSLETSAAPKPHAAAMPHWLQARRVKYYPVLKTAKMIGGVVSAYLARHPTCY